MPAFRPDDPATILAAVGLGLVAAELTQTVGFHSREAATSAALVLVVAVKGASGMRKRFWLFSFLIATGACANSDNDPATRRDTLTQRQRDSIVAESKLPGARAVGAALRASDSMAKRARALDSIPR